MNAEFEKEVRRRQAKLLREDAEQDLRMAEDHIEHGWYSDSCSHSQQAAEKILKAFLRLQGVIAKGHYIWELLRKASTYGVEVEDLRGMPESSHASTWLRVIRTLGRGLG